MNVNRLLRDFVSLFYPSYCYGCYGPLIKGEHLICSRCILSLPQTYFHLDPENSLKRRMFGRLPVAHALAFLRFTKSGRIQGLLHHLKYKNRPEIGVALGKVYASKILEAGFVPPFHVIVPVPLHPSRLRRRGYNQSAKFGEGLSDIFQIPVCEDILTRRIKTDTQTRKNKLERWENVAEVFEANTTAEIRDKHILLIDDVITTGATIDACGQALVRAGCSEISIAGIAVA
jgi:ComF family protein